MATYVSERCLPFLENGTAWKHMFPNLLFSITGISSMPGFPGELT